MSAKLTLQLSLPAVASPMAGVLPTSGPHYLSNEGQYTSIDVFAYKFLCRDSEWFHILTTSYRDLSSVIVYPSLYIYNHYIHPHLIYLQLLNPSIHPSLICNHYNHPSHLFATTASIHISFTTIKSISYFQPLQPSTSHLFKTITFKHPSTLIYLQPLSTLISEGNITHFLRKISLLHSLSSKTGED